jgi:hypothetical protein
MASLVAPGEAVGVLAAQSLGEPSTQVHFCHYFTVNSHNKEMLKISTE